MPRSSTPTSWCPRSSGRARPRTARRDLRPRPRPLGSVHVCYWGYAPDAPHCRVAGGGRRRHRAGRVSIRGRRRGCRPLPALPPVVPGQGAAADPGSATRCRETRNLLELRTVLDGSRRISCSADRAGSATPQGDSRRRPRQTGRPVQGHRSLRRCTGCALVRHPGGRRAAHSWSATSTAAARPKPLVDLDPGRLGPPDPVWRRPRARNRRRRRIGSASRPRATWTGRAVGLGARSRGGLRSGYAHCSGVGRAPDRTASAVGILLVLMLALAGCVYEYDDGLASGSAPVRAGFHRSGAAAGSR